MRAEVGVNDLRVAALTPPAIALLSQSPAVCDGAGKACCSHTHKELCDGVVDIARRVQSDQQLTSLIRRKFAIKCTTGYSLNALVDFPLDNPIEIIKHLMIGSEGTFGFVSQVCFVQALLRGCVGLNGSPVSASISQRFTQTASGGALNAPVIIPNKAL
eukprot:scaffold47142_cov20-Tisochrysis_lutea.AAC.4